MKMTDPKILFDDVTHLGDLFIPVDFYVSELGGSGDFAHNAIGDLVVGEEMTVGQSGVAFVA